MKEITEEDKKYIKDNKFDIDVWYKDFIKEANETFGKLRNMFPEIKEVEQKGIIETVNDFERFANADSGNWNWLSLAKHFKIFLEDLKEAVKYELKELIADECNVYSDNLPECDECKVPTRLIFSIKEGRYCRSCWIKKRFSYIDWSKE